MTARTTVKSVNRKEEMARALAFLLIAVGVVLIGAGWLFNQNTRSAPVSITELQAKAAQPLAATPAALADRKLDTTMVTPPEPIVPPPAAPKAESKPEPPPAPKAAEPEPKPEPEQKQTLPSKPETTTADSNTDSDSKTGWIYAGQFSDGQWLEQGLIIGNTLPTEGQSYNLNWGANIRPEPPGKNTDLSQTVGYLAQGRSVTILQVKKSGNKGHIWVKIKP